MRILLFFLILLPVLAFSQVGGAGTCHVSGNPNSVSALETQDMVSECLTAIDTLTGTLYRYNPTLSVGARWVVADSDTNTNFANTDLTLTGNRTHALGGNTFRIRDAGDNYPDLFMNSTYGLLGSDANTYLDVGSTAGRARIVASTTAQLTSAANTDVSATDTVTITGQRIRMNAADTRIQQVSKSNTLNRVMMIDSTTEQIYYRDVSSIAGGGGGGSGTVTSITAGVGLTGGTITTSGTIDADTSGMLVSKSFLTNQGYTTNTGTVTGTGTTGTIPVWSSSTALGDSPLTVASGNVSVSGTGAFRLGNWTTAGRPGTPTSGMKGYNTTLGYPETYGASAWLQSAFPTGTSGQTLRSDGTNWVASSALTNDATNVAATGAISGTAHISTSGSCSQPSGGHFVSTGATGAIEITLPVLTVNAFNLKFKVSVSSLSFGAQTFEISMYGTYQTGSVQPYSQSNFHVVGGSRRASSNVRLGSDGTNIKVWIDEIGTNWGSMSVRVEDVHFARVSGTYPTALNICTGWTITMENTAFNTINVIRPINYQPSRIIEVSDNVGLFDFYNEVKPILAGAYLGTFTGAIQINLPDSTLVLPAGEVDVEISIRYTTTSTENIRELKIYAKYRYNSRSWGSSFVSPQDGAGRQLTVRLGREGTVPCIYIGETSSVFSGLGVAVSGLNTWNTSTTTHNALIQNAWGVTTEASSFSNVTQTITGVTAGALPVTSATGWVFSENLLWDNANTRLGIGTNAPTRTLHNAGETRLADLTTTTATLGVGADTDGVLSSYTFGAGLSFAANALTASNFYNANGTLTGARTVTLGSNTLTLSGTSGGLNGVNFSMTPSTNTTTFQSLDGSLNNSAMTITPTRTQIVTTNVTAGTAATFAVFADSVRISPTAVPNDDAQTRMLAINASTGRLHYVTKSTINAPSYNFAELTVSGGSTSATAGTPERPDNDTPGSATSTIVGTFTASGSTLDYTGAAGQGKVSGVISFTTSGGGDVLISIYKEGTEIASTEVREAVNAIYTTVALPLATIGMATNDTFEIRIEPVTGSNTITVHRYTLFIEKIY